MFINPTYRQCHLGREQTIVYREINHLKQVKQYNTDDIATRNLYECSECGELYVGEEHHNMEEPYGCVPVNKIFIPVPSLEVADLVGNFGTMPYIQLYCDNGYNGTILFPAYLEFDQCVQYSGEALPCHWHTFLPKMANFEAWKQWCIENIIAYDVLL